MRGAIALLCGILGALMVSGAVALAQTPVEDQPIWTDAPRAVDRERQDFQRLPPRPLPSQTPGTSSAPTTGVTAEDEYPLQLDGRTGYRILDSISFMSNGKRYRLADLEPVAPNRSCRTLDGSRWACGLRSRATLSTLLNGTLLRCRQIGEAGGMVRVACLRRGRDAGLALVQAGFAMPQAGTQTYAAAAQAAKDAGSGIWSDVAAR